jgi:hypothetical protein
MIIEPVIDQELRCPGSGQRLKLRQSGYSDWRGRCPVCGQVVPLTLEVDWILDPHLKRNAA